MTSPGKPIIVFGAGGLAADVLDIIARIGGMQVEAFVVDRDPPDAGADNFPVLHWDDVKDRPDAFSAINAIGRPARRTLIEKAEAAGFEFAAIIDPSAQVFPTASVGAGAVIGAGVVVAAQVRLGRHVFVNRGVLIGHHTRVDAFSSLQAGANIGGFSHLGEETEVGLGACIIDRVKVGARSTVGAGSVLVRDCEADSVMVGVPARRRPA